MGDLRQDSAAPSDEVVAQDATATIESPRAGVPSGEPAGAMVGRYVVLEQVGRGAMGRVLRAYDPKLQREVALKVMQRAALGPGGERQLAAEARAMAKLSHRNVVVVYDVEAIERSELSRETAGRELVLVMQYVAGPTLRAWQNEEKRPWREIVARFIEAGRGLAAAHAAGILHLDFKPSNVLLATDTVKVTDFGLARFHGETVASAPDCASSDLVVECEPSTDAGAVVGTPRYMAPEQHDAERLTAAADQYAFCVALWEALCGEAPFRGGDLGKAKRAGPPPWPNGAVPRRLADAVRRGLAADPSQRWPNIDALLDELAHDPGRTRGRWLAAAGALAVSGLGGAIGQSWAAARAERCSGAEAGLAGAWDDERRGEVQAALLEVGATYATRVWEQTAEELDAYAAAWTAMHVEACEATLRGEQSAAVMDLRMACLQRAKADLVATTAALAVSDAEVVRKAHELTAGLLPLSRCADVEALLADVEPPLPEEREAVDEIRARLSEVKAARNAGRYAHAQAGLEAVEAQLDVVQYGPVRAEVALAKGRVLGHLGEYEAAEDALRAALQLAAKERQSTAIADVAAQLMFVVGVWQQRFDEGLSYRELALPLAEGDPEREATARDYFALVLGAQGKYEQAEAEHRRALELVETALGVDHPRVAKTLLYLAGLRRDQGAYDDAATLAERAREIQEQAWGPDHPDVGQSLNAVARVHELMGAYDDAATVYERVLHIAEAALGPDHPDVATALTSIANVHWATGAYQASLPLHERALGIFEKRLGPHHPHVAHVLNSLAILHHVTGAYEHAAKLHERALRIREQALGPDHPAVADTLSNLGALHLARDAYDDAQASHERALRIRERVLDADHPDVASSLNNLALVHRARGAYEEAAPLLQRALEIRERALGPDHLDVANSLSNLARLHFATRAYEDAERLHGRALEIQERTLGPDHPDVAYSLCNLADVRAARRAYDDAVLLLERALAIHEKAMGPDHPDVAHPLVRLAGIALMQHRKADAVALAERAVMLRQAGDTPAVDLAEARFVLARALAVQRRAPARAITLASRARDAYAAAGDEHRDALVEVKAWLAAHRPGG